MTSAQAADGRPGRRGFHGRHALLPERRQDGRGEGRRPPRLTAWTCRRSISPSRKKDGKTAELLVGDSTLDSAGAYAKLAGDPRVFTIANVTKTSLDKNPDDLRDKRLLTFDSDKLTRVELQAKGQAIEFGKNGQNEWQIVKPRPLRADSSAVTSLVDKLKDAKMDTSELPEDAAKKFAAAAKVALRHGHRFQRQPDARGPQGQGQELLRQELRGGRRLENRGRYRRRARQGPGRFPQQEALRFRLQRSQQDGAEGREPTPRAGDKWMLGPKTMDNATVQTLIDKLRDLSATKFAEKGGGGDAVFEATVISNDGKRVEKVVHHQAGERIFRETRRRAQHL